MASRKTTPSVDLTTGTGLEEFITNVENVVHIASNPTDSKRVDIGGTRRILDHISTQHLVYMSIVGVDRHPLPYYKAKYRAEQMIADSGVSHSIVSATQFHDFIALLISKLEIIALVVAPRGFVFQPVATDDVCQRGG